jgi:competence protein ComEC
MQARDGKSAARCASGVGSRPITESKRGDPLSFVIAPLAPLVAAMAAGIVADRWLEPCETKVWVTTALILGAIAALTTRLTSIFCVAMLAAIAAIGGGWHHHRWSDQSANDLARSVTETPRPVWVRGVVTEARGLRHRRDGFGIGKSAEEKVTTRFVLDITSISDGARWHNASGRALVVVAGDRSEIRAGQAVEAAGQVARIAARLNPGEFDYRAFLQAQGIRLRLSVDDAASFWLDPHGQDWPFTLWMDRQRYWSRTRLFDWLDPTTAPLAAALLLGWREEIDPEINDAFARTGTTHLLAVSGLQLQALAISLLLIFRVLAFPRRISYLVVGMTMIGYALLVGPAPSVVRSTVMTSTFCLAAIAQRLARSANTLSLAALCTLVINPMYLFDVGCQLSFLAIGALVWLVSPACTLVRDVDETIRSRLFGPRSALDDLERVLEPAWRTVLRQAGARVIDGIVASAVVWLAALPLVALQFHLVSPIGILLNIPLIPITSAALLLGGLSLVLSLLWGALGSSLAWAAACLLKLTQTIVLWGVAQPLGHRFVVGPAWGWVLFFYALLGVAAVAANTSRPRPHTTRTQRVWRYGVWCLLAAWFLPGWWLAGVAAREATLEVEVLAVGHGLAVVLQLPDGQTLLYDCGRLGDPTVGRRIIAPALWARGVNRIDVVFLSHADQDHYDGLPDLLDRFPIAEVRLPPGFAGVNNPLAIELIDQLQKRAIPVRPITAPARWEQAGVQFTVWHPPDGWHPETSDNSRSLVLDVGFAGRHLLLTGDLEQQGLDQVVASPPPQPAPDAFLAPHHGGKSSNPEWLYHWAKPRAVVVSQRLQSAHAGDALATLEERGIPVLRTWRQGAIRLRWVDDGIAASGFVEPIGDQDRNAVYPRTTRPEWSSITPRLAPTTVVGDRRRPSAASFLVGGMGFILGAIACLVLAVIEFGAWVLVAPPRSMNVDDEEVDDSTRSAQAWAEPIEIRAADGARLVGRWLPAPAAIVTGRTALLLHGFAEASSVLEARRAVALNRRGWNVAVLDSRGYGQSGGAFGTFGGLEAGDIRLWLDSFHDRIARTGLATPLRPVLWGRSMGAAIALRAAAENHRLVALVLESPMVDLETSMAIVLGRRRLPCAKLLARLITCRASKLASVPIHRPRPIDSAPNVTCPTLIVHGTNDTLVSIEQARRLAQAFATEPHWIEVPDARHTDVIDKGGEPLLDRIAGFLEEVTAEPAASRLAMHET